MSQDTVNLLCVLGATPAVVTETIYALVTGSDPVSIENLYIVTTTLGREKLNAVLDDQLDVLRREYPSIADRVPTTSKQMIRVPTSADGSEVEDIRTRGDGAVMSELIWKLVRELTEEGSYRLHASIAGGRKTMSFMLGNAMTVFARRSDRLSHVLVSSRAESCPDFYFPPRSPMPLETFAGEEFDASAETIELHEIGFVRLRGRLDRLDELTHVELVGEVQDQLDRELTLRVDLNSGEVHLGTEHIRLEPATSAVFAALAVAHSRGDTPIRARTLLERYAGDMDGVHARAGEEDQAFFTLFASQPAAIDPESSKFEPAAAEKAKKNLRQHLSVVRQAINSEARQILPPGASNGYRLNVPVDRLELVRPRDRE